MISMSLVINTNIASLTATRALQGTDEEMKTAMERLATGSKINSSADDAAGLAIGQRMTAQVRGLNMAVKNAGDGMAMTRTIESALNTISDMIQRMRELSVQAVNATNSSRDRSFLQQEVNQLIQEINRVSSTSQFNGEKILDGTFVNKVVQLGMEEGENLTLSVASISAEKIGAYVYYGQGTDAAAAAGTAADNAVTVAEDLTIVGSLGTTTITAAANDSARTTAEKINAVSGSTGVSATAQTYVRLASDNATSESYAIKINGVSSGNFTISSSLPEDAVRAINSVAGSTGVTATSTASGAILLFDNDGDVFLTSATGEIVEIPDDNDNLVIGLGFAIEIPEGYVGLLFPRSSIAKTGHSFRNSVGVIDSGYRGELMIKLSSKFDKNSYKINERVGQLMILPYPQIEFEQAEHLTETKRSTGGFGSTGN